MNKKGMSGIMLTLIISTIGIASIFIGVFLAYHSFAKDMGISYEIPTSISSEPNYPSKIVITGVEHTDFNKTSCAGVFSENFCNSLGLEENLNYTYVKISFDYMGNPSPVFLSVTEKQEQGSSSIEKTVVTSSTGYIVHFSTSASVHFIAVKNTEPECNGATVIYTLSSNHAQ